MNRLLYIAIFAPLTILAGCGDNIEQKQEAVTNVPQQDSTAAVFDGSELDQIRANAEDGYANAQYNLGLMYRFGEGVPQNYAEAMKWFKLAADQGNARAQCNLGVMYINGEGGPQNYAEAYAWIAVAGAGGDDTANHMLEVVAEGFTPDELSQAQQRATELFEKIESGKKQ